MNRSLTISDRLRLRLAFIVLEWLLPPPPGYRFEVEIRDGRTRISTYQSYE